MSAEPTDVVIVGAGILGLANAWAASRQGRTVRVIEKSPFAQGASIRNFGMVWPVGQPADRVDLALASRDRWLELVQAGAVEGTRCGSIHLATDDLEATVMPELSKHVVSSRTLTPKGFLDDYLSFRGAAFGFEPVLTQSAWFRPHNKSEDVEGLYLVGAGTHPGGGMPGVLSSARVLDTVIPDPDALRR
jgi:phytoene dehydrogenase-like protein